MSRFVTSRERDLVSVAIGQVDPVTVIERELGEEFAGQLPDATIRRLAKEEVAAFANAHVQDFVPVLAGRRARARAKEIVASHRAMPAAGAGLD